MGTRIAVHIVARLVSMGLCQNRNVHFVFFLGVEVIRFVPNSETYYLAASLLSFCPALVMKASPPEIREGSIMWWKPSKMSLPEFPVVFPSSYSVGKTKKWNLELWTVRNRVKFHRTEVLGVPSDAEFRDLSFEKGPRAPGSHPGGKKLKNYEK